MVANRSSLKNILRLPYQGIKEHTDSTSLSLEAMSAGENASTPIPTPRRKWLFALQQVFPLYFAVHLAALFITGLATLFLRPDFSQGIFPLDQLWLLWNRWDTGHYIFLATSGYTVDRTVFFPLYPALMHVVMPVFSLFHNSPLLAGLAISAVTNLVWMVALYQLVLEDFGQETAQRTILYLSIFPAAFFFLAAYTESLFLCLAVLSFYHARRGNWWLSGLFGLFACLTRQTGLALLLPFGYEYLRQRQFQIRKIRLSVISGFLIPTGIIIFALYCWQKFGDPLAFSHEEYLWQRALRYPGWGILKAISFLRHTGGLLNFYVLRDLTDFVPVLFILGLLIFGCIGPWRFKKDHWAYLVYAVPLFILFNLYPTTGVGQLPLVSFARYMLELFPAFITLAILGGKWRWLNLSYTFASSAICYFLLTQFLTGHWVI